MGACNKEEECIDADNREVLHGAPRSQVELALKSYYTRYSEMLAV
jgi:hypothetical protein